MEITNIELLLDNKSNTEFPLVSEYINRNTSTFFNPESVSSKFTENDKVNFIKKVELVNNSFEIPTNIDLLHSIEITGLLDRPIILSTSHHERLNEVYKKIKSIDFEIGGTLITKIYLHNKICEIQTNNYFFTIHINLKELFYNYDFLPIISLVFNQVKFTINSYYSNYDIYVGGSIISSPFRNSLIGNRYEILYKDFIKYDGIINGNKLNINLIDDKEISSHNFISSLYFKFETNIRDNLKYISLIKKENNENITFLPYSKINFINDYEFIIEQFHYKTFLFREIIIEFSMFFTNSHYTIITTNYNQLNIFNGRCEKVFDDLARNIHNYYYDEYEEISNDLYNEKVVVKNDSICAITHEEFTNNETRIICSYCYSSFMKNAIRNWFSSKYIKICPYCRTETNKWYKKTFI
jgi:hypothetical protein